MFVVLWLMLTALPVAAQDDEPETMLLNFIPNIQYAPFYVAQEMGLFAEQGLTITYDYLEEPLVLDLVASGEASLGMVSGEQVILARAQQRPVTMVYEWYQQYPVGVVAPASSGIESAADLAGVEVGLPGRFGANYIAFTALLSSAGLAEDEVNLQEIGYNAPEVVCVGGVEASVVYINNEPLQIQERAERGDCGTVEAVTVIPVSSVSDLISNGIITNETTIEQNPDLLRDVVAAFDEAVQMSIQNPARAYLLSVDYIESLPASDELVAALEALAAEQDAFLATEPTAEDIAQSRAELLETLQADFDSAELLQFQVLLETIPLWEAEQLGFSEVEAWENMQQTLLQIGLIEAATDLEAAFTNDFLP